MKISYKQFIIFVFSMMCYMVLVKVCDILFANPKGIPHEVVSSKQISYKQQKALIHNHVNKFIIVENLTLLDQKPRKKKKKSPKQTLYTGNRLNRLLYQLWDPNSEINEQSLISCDHLSSTDENVYQKGKRFARKLNRKFFEYADISDIWDLIRHNCNSLRKLFRFQNPKFGPASYSIAYTITLERTAEQSIRMLLSIYHHDNVYCVHPNARYGFKYYNVFRKISECIPNIVLPDRIFEIRLKTHNRLKAELACFKKLLNTSVPWKYGINLPSSAFPLRNNSYLVKHLKAKPYEVSISWEKPVHEHFLRRVKYSFSIKELESGEKAFVRTSKKKSDPPGNIQFYRRGIHFISTRQFYHFLTESTLAKEFLNWTKDAKNPEDFYYSSLYKYYDVSDGMPVDPLGSTLQQLRPVDNGVEDVSAVPSNELIISLWSSDRGHKCHGKYRGSVCIFSAEDLRWLLQQEYLFANSFDFRVDRVVIDCLSKNLKQPILLPDLELD